MTVSYGVGKTTGGSGWSWYAAEWSHQSGNDRYWKSKDDDHRFDSTGTWYYSGRFVWTADGYTEYASGDWAENRTTLSASSYFTVNALNNPSGQSATRDSTNPHSQINLGWTRGTSGVAKDTVIFRSTSSTAPTPVGGTSYSSGNNYTLGGITYRCVYKGSGTSHNDSDGLSAGTTYYYYFFAENNSYYSSGVTANTTTRPTDATWDGGGANNNTLTEANWSGNLYPHPSASSIMRFAGSTRTTPSVDHAANSAFHSIYFNSGAAAFTLSGNAMNIHSLIRNDSSNLQTINNNLTLSAATTANAASGNMTLDGVISGANNLTKSGNNMLTLSGNNTFSGTLTLGGGTLRATGTHAGALGDGALALNTAGTTLDFYGSANRVYGNNTTISANMTIVSDRTTSGAGRQYTLGTLAIGSQTLTLNAGGNVTSGNPRLIFGATSLSGSPTFNVSGSGTELYLNGVVSGAHGITKTGTGMLRFNSNNTFSGGLTVNEGIVRAVTSANAFGGSGTGTITLGDTSGSADVILETTLGSTFANPITIRSGSSGTVTLRNQGNNVLTLSGNITQNKPFSLFGYATTAGTRGITLSGAITGSSAITVNSDPNAFVQLSGNNAATFSGPVTVDSGFFRLGSDNALSSANTVTMAGTATMEVNNSVTIGALTGASGNTITRQTTGARTLTVSQTTDTTFAGVMENGSGTLALTKAGSGKLTLSGDNTFSGGTTISAGTLQIGDGTALGGNSFGHVGNIVNNAALILNRGSTGGYMDAVEYDGVISGSGTVTKEGSGNLVLTGNNTYTGNTTINGTGWLGIGAGGTSGAIAGNIIVNSGELWFYRSNEYTYGGVVSGSGGMVGKDAAGTLILTGNNTYTGDFDMYAGALQIGNGGTSGAWAGDIIARNTRPVTFNRSDDLTYGGEMSGTGSLTKQGAGTLTMTGANTYSGASTISAGTLIMSGSANNSAFTVSSGATLMGAGSVGNLTVTGTVDPGNAVGNRATLNCGTLTLNAGGEMIVDISAMTGTAGTHWDLIDASGTVTVSATSGDPFVIKLVGNPAFNASSDYTLKIINGGGMSGFDTDKFDIDVTDFDPELFGGEFEVRQDGNNILLAFVPSEDPLALWNFQDVVSPADVAANLHASDITVSAGSILFQNGTDDGGTRIGYASSWNQDPFDPSGKYLEFSITPTNGYQLALDRLTVRLGRTTTGPTKFTLQYSADGFATKPTTIASGLDITSTSTAALDSFDLSDIPVGPRTNTITFRLWGHDASGTGNLRMNNFRVFGTLSVAPAPDFDVLGTNLAVIADGEDTPTTAKGTDFGEVEIGDTLTHTFTITNTGTASLLLEDISIGGAHEGDFTVTVQPAVRSANLLDNPGFENGSGDNFTDWARWDGLGAEGWGPVRTGSRAAMMKGWTTGGGLFQDYENDAAGVEYEFSIWAYPSWDWEYDHYPDMKMFIQFRDDSDTLILEQARHEPDMDGLTETWTRYTISGVAPTGTDVVRVGMEFGGVGSAGAGTFNWDDAVLVIREPTSGESVTFDIEFEPSEAGVREATVYITNNVPAKNPYTFDIQGTGVWPTPIQASNLVLLSRGKDSIEVEWENGSGSRRIVVVTEYDAAGLWLFDEGAGTAVADETVNENHGTLSGSYSWTTRPGGDGALTFSGGHAGLTDPWAGTPNTMAAWVKVSSGIADGTRVGTIAGNFPNANNINWEIHQLGRPRVWWNNGEIDWILTGVDLRTDEWMHIAWVRDTDAGQFRVYVNGHLEGTHGSVGTDITPASASRIGNDHRAAPGIPFTGDMDEVLVLPYALSSEQVTNLFRMGSMGRGWEPTDGVAPSGVSHVWGSAADQGFNSRIVYDWTGSSWEVVGLKTNTAYRFRVFEYNGTGEWINYNTDTAVDNPMTFTTLDNEPEIGHGPLTLTPSATVGSNPGAQSFGVTNIGGGSLSYVIDKDEAWLTVAPMTATNLAAGQSQSHTVSYDVTGMGAGVHTALVTIANTGGGVNEAINSPQYVSVSMTLNAIPNPSVATATADGNEFVRLAWTKHASHDVMIVHREGAAPTAPTQGASYSVGSSVGGGTVIYKGGGASLEHEVATDTTHYYTIYSINNNHYSSGLTDDAEMDSYAFGEIFEPFSYTNSATSGIHFNGKDGGVGWTNAWSVSSGGGATWSVIAHDDTDDGRPEFSEASSNQVAISGNRVFLNAQGANRWGIAERGVEAVDSGSIYVSALIAYRYQGESDGTDRWATLALMDGDTEEMEFGKVYGGGRLLTIRRSGANAASSYNINPYVNGDDNWYWIVLKYDFENNRARLWGFYRSENIPHEEPSGQDADWSDLSIDQVTGIRLKAGGDVEWLGGALFDEVRVARTWSSLIGLPPPTPQTRNTDGEEDPEQPAYIYLGDTNKVFGFESWGELDGNWGAPRLWMRYDNTDLRDGVHTPWGSFVDTDHKQVGSLQFTQTGTWYWGIQMDYGAIYGTNYWYKESLDDWTDMAANGAGASLSVEVAPLGEPSNFSAFGGEGQVYLQWNRWTGDDTQTRRVLLVGRANEPVNWTPTQGTTYSSTGHVGDGNEILAFNSDWNNYTHQNRTNGVTYHYKLWTANHHYYSPAGVTASAVPAPSKVIYDWFQTTGHLNNRGGGTGWGANNWSSAHDTDHYIIAGSFPGYTWSAPEPMGNMVRLIATADGSERWATRQFGSSFTEGQVYFHWIQNFDHTGTDNSAYAGLFPMDGENALAFIGKTPDDDKLGLAWWDGGIVVNSEQGMASGMGNDYVIVARYDFETRELSASRYSADEVIAEEPRSYWDVSVVLGEGVIEEITGVRIQAGVHSDLHGNIGNAYFDEIRVGTNWYEVTRRYGEVYSEEMATGPVPTLIYVGTQAFQDVKDHLTETDDDITVFDSDLVNIETPLSFAVRWDDPNGVWLTNSNPAITNFSSREGRVMPNWDPAVLEGEELMDIGYDTVFEGFYGVNGATVVTTYHNHAFNITESSWDDRYFMTVSAENDNDGEGYFAAPNSGDDIPYLRAITVNYPLEFYVQDDDTDPPELGDVDTLLRVQIGDRAVEGSDDTTNAVFTITDAELAALGGSGNLLADPSFETGEWETGWDYFGPDESVYTDNWGYAGPTMEAPFNYDPHHGEWAMLHIVKTSDHTAGEDSYWRGIYQSVEAVPGETYHAGVFLRMVNTEHAQVFLEIKFLDEHGAQTGPGFESEWVDEDQDFTLLEVRDAVAPEDADRVQVSGVIFAMAGNGEHIIFDDFSLRRGPNLTLSLYAYDAFSGLSRGTDIWDTDLSHLTIGDGLSPWIVENVENYVWFLSTADTTDPEAFTSWEFPGPVGYEQVGELFDAEYHPVIASFSDADFDRDGDNLWLEDQQFGILRVIDDDTEPPEIQAFTINDVGMTAEGLLPGGGIAIVGVNGHPATGDGDGGGETFSFVVLSPFPEGTRIWFTDCGWSNQHEIGWHRITEFHLAYWDSTGGEAVGDVITLVMTNINNGGDQVAVYQYSGSGDPKNDPENVKFIYAVQMGKPWDEPPVPDDNESSALYYGLTNEVTAVDLYGGSGSAVNWTYVGPRSGTASDLLLQISDRSNWEREATSVDMDFDDIFEGGFAVLGPGDLEWDTPIITDAQLNQGDYTVFAQVQDITAGLQATATDWAPPPHFVLFNAEGDMIASNNFVAGFDSGSTDSEELSMAAGPAGDYYAITLGEHFAHLVISDADNDRPNDNLLATNILSVMVVDDDPYPPRIGPARIEIKMGGETLAPVPTSASELLAAWNFNDEEDRTGVSHGAGEMTYTLGGGLSYYGGSTVNRVGDDPAGEAFSPEYVGNIGGHFQFQIDMSEYMALEMSFAVRRTTAGYDANQVSYSLDGVNFTPFGDPFDPTTSTTLERLVFDFSSVPELNGQPEVFIRITLGVDAASGAGNNRYDNIQFNAYPLEDLIFEVTDAQLAEVGALNPLAFGFNVYDPISGVARGSTHDGINMVVTIDGLFDEDPGFDSGLSSLETFEPDSFTVWLYDTVIPYEDRGVLYGDGETLRDITATFADMDDDRVDDRSWYSNALFAAMRIIDDDEDPPELRTIHYAGGTGTRPFWVSTNDASPSALRAEHDPVVRRVRRDGTGTNTLFTLTDAEMADPEAHGIRFAFGARDEYSGVARPGMDLPEVMSFSLGSVVVDNTAGFNAGLSTAQTTTNQVLTNVWAVTRTWTLGDITTMMNAGDLPVTVTIPDTDDDRPDDQAILENHQAGLIRVVDDDIYPPLMGALDLDISSTHNLFVMGFETYHGWTNHVSSPAYANSPWINDIGTNRWIVEDGIVSHLIAGNHPSQQNVVGLRNQGAEVGRILTPFVEDPGTLFMWTRLSAAPAKAFELEVEISEDGLDWTSLGTREVPGADWTLLDWKIDLPDMWAIRVNRVTDDSVQNRTIYIDDLILTRRPAWTNATEMNVSFDNAEDYSGIYQYRTVTDVAAPNWQQGSNILEGVVLATNFNNTISLNEEGILTGFVFAVDADMDRPDDQLRNPGIPYVVRIDHTPPPAVGDLFATSAAEEEFYHFDEIDITTEIGLLWPPFSSEAVAAGPRAADQMHLSPWDTFIITYVESDYEGNPLPGAPTLTVTRASSGFTNLHNWAETNAVLTDLSFDSYYYIEIQGRDEAGNVGPATPIIGNTERFALTQGVARATSHVELYWDFSPGRPYDLISVDAPGFSMATTNYWELVATDVTNMIPDNTPLAPGYLRFYRAAHHNRWKPDRPRRLASEEVYVRKDYQLHPGENWVDLPGIPDTNTVTYIFGTDLPAGIMPAQATVIRWWEQGPDPVHRTNELWLDSNQGQPMWRDMKGNTASETPLPEGAGIEVVIRGNDPQMYTFIGRVPTNTMTQTVKGGSHGELGFGGGVVNLVQFRVPRPMHPRDLNLAESGFTGAGNDFQSDWLITWDAENQQVRDVFVYRTNTSPPRWQRMAGGAVTDQPIKPGDGMVILRRMNRGDFTWTNSIPYPSPTRWINP